MLAMSTSTELLLCGGLLAGLAGLGLLGLATVRLLFKRLEKADGEDFSVDIPATEEAAKFGPSMQDVQAAIDELTSFSSVFARPRGMKRKSRGLVGGSAAYAGIDVGNEVGFALVPRAR